MLIFITEDIPIINPKIFLQVMNIKNNIKFKKTLYFFNKNIIYFIYIKHNNRI